MGQMEPYFILLKYWVFNLFRKLGLKDHLQKNKILNLIMNDDNKAIFDYLNDFVQGNEPDYAVFLKGRWGCGKTFFIQQWMKNVKDDKSKDDDIEIKPIYVSLYGVDSIEQISIRISKALHPILNSKLVKNLKKIALTLGSAVLKYNLNKGNEELSVNLDLLDIILGNDNHGLKIKGKRILIFDDFERCRMLMEEALGYINNFVEHNHCYVIILGDDTKFGNNVETFEKIKEKTIGREFEITPDIENAVDFFIKAFEPTEQNRLKENRELIIDLFKTSLTNNLRILKHALSDYNQCIGKLSKNVTQEESYSTVIQHLLSNFILCYLELLSSKKEEKEKAENMESTPDSDENHQMDDNISASLFIEDEKMRSLILCQDKYKVVSLLYHLSLPNTEFCTYILDYLDKGRFDFKEVENKIKMTVKKPIKYLCDLSNITDKGFLENYSIVQEAYYGEKYGEISDIFDGGAILMYYAHEGLANLNYKDIIQHAERMMKIETKDLSALYQLEVFLLNRSNYFSRFGIQKELNEFVGTLQKKVEEKKKSAKDEMTLYLENLNDANIDKMDEMLAKSLPDYSRAYNMSAIFEHVDIDQFTNGYLSLGNIGKNIFLNSMIKHYQNVIGTVNAVQFIHYYEADINPLREIVNKMKAFQDKDKLISTFQTKQMAHQFEMYANKIEEIASHKPSES